MHQKRNHTSDKYLEHDMARVIHHYPGFTRRISGQGLHVLEGEFTITDSDGTSIDTVALKMIYPKAFPFAYPLVMETGGRFSRQNGQMHLNGDGTLCLTSPQQEKVNCYTGMDTLRFFDEVLVPNLSWRICVLEGIPFERKEFGHSMDGIIQSYQELFSLKETAKIYEFINRFLNNTLPGRNLDCFCGSGKKYKSCHGLMESNLVKIGNGMLKAHLPMIGRFKK